MAREDEGDGGFSTSQKAIRVVQKGPDPRMDRAKNRSVRMVLEDSELGKTKEMVAFQQAKKQ